MGQLAAVLVARENDPSDRCEERSEALSKRGGGYSVQPEVTSTLYGHIDHMRKRFFGGDLPEIVLSFEVADKRTRGSHRTLADRLGRRWAINLNPVYLAAPLVDVLTTLLHELTHVWQHEHGSPAKPPYHNAEFRKMCDGFGIPTDERGHYSGARAGTLFSEYCRANGVAFPGGGESQLDEASFITVKPPKPKGSRLKKWTCLCGINVRVAVAAFDATCNRCGGVFRVAD